MNELKTNRGFWGTILLTAITGGIYYLWLLNRFAADTNLVCKEDGKHTQGIWVYIGLSIVTFGIYGIVWLWGLQDRRHDFLIRANQPSYYSGLKSFCFSYLLAVTIACPIISFCKTIYQQNGINKLYNVSNPA
jgi:hypothetical protein